MSKLKGADILIIIAAVVVVGLLIYNFTSQSNQESETSPTQAETSKTAPTSDEIRSRAIQWSDDPETLREQMRGANRDQTLAFMSYLRERGLPEGYEHPQFLLDAGSGKESARLIGERFPEFYGLGGEALINAAKQHPVRFKEMIEYSLSYREIYAHEVEHIRREQAEKEAAKQR
jgi:hypothetical protein